MRLEVPEDASRGGLRHSAAETSQMQGLRASQRIPRVTHCADSVNRLWTYDAPYGAGPDAVELARPDIHHTACACSGKNGPLRGRDVPDPMELWHKSTIALRMESVKDVLGAAGIWVATASDGRQAVALFEQADRRFDTVVLDWQMPVMGGEQTSNQLHRSDPLVRVLVSTGGYGNGDVLPGVPDGCNALFLQKSFTTAELLEKIRELISNSSQAS